MEMNKFILALLLVALATTFSGVVSTSPPPVTQQTLQNIAGSLQMYVDPLPRMAKLYGYSAGGHSIKPGSLTIGMFQKKWKFHRDLPASTVFVYGTSLETATFPGPTIEALKGVPLKVTWQNHLPKSHILPWDPTVPTAIPKNGGVPTVVHLHGGIHEPQSDGSALAWFTTGFAETGPKWSKATYTYPNVQHAGNLWYHDHALGLTRANLLAGLIAAYVIRDPKLEAPLRLPSGDDYDIHLMIADRSFYSDGSIYMNSTGNVPNIHPEWQPEYFGEAVTVNGKAWPYLSVERRRYRFRIINTSNARYLRLSLSDGTGFSIIGSDSSYLPAPVTATSLLVAPAETFDLVIDFSGSAAAVEMVNGAAYPYPTGSPVDSLNGKVMKFVVGNEKVTDDSTVPSKLVTYAPAVREEAVLRRYITMYEYQTAAGEPTHLYINGKRFEDPVTEKPQSGSTEVWEVINLTGDNHPLHIHLGVFQAIKIQQLVDQTTFQNCMTTYNDAIKCNISGHATGPTLTVPDHEKTWKNVVKIEPGYIVSAIVKFHLVDSNAPYPFDATAEPGYVYHCHILDHEDNAMIRPMKLVS
ncbi:hypothetical protein QJS10_CPA03g00501 [Acorus calamus]|uniref:Uncharacterized protein n=1 Tax=Acorus calamus TaxID=4465 RepID=A0AAV9FA07_ACOCL|nr:hypothetical protein QJS10_CPA03g00501 [Acorus calamus]